MPGLEDIKGLGPAKVAKLRAAGIQDLQDLASLDLRRPHEIGIGNDVLRGAKKQARQLLDQEGKPYQKAPYGGAPAKKARPASTAAATRARPAAVAPASTPSTSSQKDAPEAPRRGFLARLFRRD